MGDAGIINAKGRKKRQMSEKNMRDVDIRKLLMLTKENNIRNARKSFWAYCCIMVPTLYIIDNWHLHLSCEILQLLYERDLTARKIQRLTKSIAPPWYQEYLLPELDRQKEQLRQTCNGQHSQRQYRDQHYYH